MLAGTIRAVVQDGIGHSEDDHEWSMMPQMEDEGGVGLRLERISLSPEVPPVPVFHFAFTRVGNQVLLEPGYVDLTDLRVALEQIRRGGGGEAKVNLFIREKYLMDRNALTRLRDAANEILEGMPESQEGDMP